ncbi:hypothetical protein AB0J90_00845 [Micromonospora sp. NPDC049523]|uniref:hypothetical protein n=1 Tax=Micromonospora sp. NPDC049523 TaxID=3155921 RepID=UPI0034211F9D
MTQQDGASPRDGDDPTEASDPEDAPSNRGYAVDIQINRRLRVKVDTEAVRHLAPEDDDDNPEGRNAEPSRPAL